MICSKVTFIKSPPNGRGESKTADRRLWWNMLYDARCKFTVVVGSYANSGIRDRTIAKSVSYAIGGKDA